VITVHLPRSLVTLFPDPPPRRVASSAGTLGELVDELDFQWPGMRDRLCEGGPRIREHINVFVNGERERDLGTRLSDGAEVHLIPAVAGGQSETTGC
jgi:molybdopterin synthase sulfur carrier subunit